MIIIDNNYEAKDNFYLSKYILARKKIIIFAFVNNYPKMYLGIWKKLLSFNIYEYNKSYVSPIETISSAQILKILPYACKIPNKREY